MAARCGFGALATAARGARRRAPTAGSSSCRCALLVATFCSRGQSANDEADVLSTASVQAGVQLLLGDGSSAGQPWPIARASSRRRSWHNTATPSETATAVCRRAQARAPLCVQYSFLDGVVWPSVAPALGRARQRLRRAHRRGSGTARRRRPTTARPASRRAACSCACGRCSPFSSGVRATSSSSPTPTCSRFWKRASFLPTSAATRARAAPGDVRSGPTAAASAVRGARAQPRPARRAAARGRRRHETAERRRSRRALGRAPPTTTAAPGPSGARQPNAPSRP